MTAIDASGNSRVNTYEVSVGSGGATFAYDANGNLTAHGTRSYQWDVEQRLVRVLENGTEVAAFTYDGAGRRSVASIAGVTKSYIYDREDIVEERTGGSVLRHVHGRGIDEPLASVSAGSVTYYLADHLGSVVQTTDASGGITLTRRYDAYGKLLEGAGIGGYAFTGREWDAGIDLYFYRSRFYEPTTSTFLSRDPVQHAGSNPYSYVEARPVTFIDPAGLWLTPFHDMLIGAGLFGTGLTLEEIRLVKTAAAEFDMRTQAPQFSALHHMTPPGMSRTAAEKAYRQFVDQQLELAVNLALGGHDTLALQELGEGLHAITDRYAPGHDEFQTWNGFRDDPAGFIYHIMRDYDTNAFWKNYRKSTAEVRMYWEKFLKRCRDKGGNPGGR